MNFSMPNTAKITLFREAVNIGFNRSIRAASDSRSAILATSSLVAVVLLFAGLPVVARADAPQEPAKAAAPAEPARHLDINEYRVEGVNLLPELEVEQAIYPFLGPDRTTDDVEQARAALEKAYNAKGYQTIAVEIPPQQVADGVVTLKVVEGKVGRLRVKGSRYYSLDEIKSEAPSVAEGTVPNFNDVSKDIIALNQQPDRKITPALRAGVTPGTVDVDLNVEDTLPLHGSLELNNRSSQNTSSLRLNATVSYANLWQAGHSVSFSYQVAPLNPKDAEVYSGSYLARLPDTSWLSFLLYGLKSDSNVATLGSTNVAGRGQVVGGRLQITPSTSEPGFFQTISFGIDYKHFDEDVAIAASGSQTPITYYPIVATYTATWQNDDSLTQLNAGVTLHTRGLGSNPAEFDAKRFNSSGDFVYFHGDISRTQETYWGTQVYGKIQGQLASQPLVNSEQLSGGGADTVRGYLESEVLGDNGVIGTLELRSPSLTKWLGPNVDEWRFYAFGEGGTLSINDPLPEQISTFNLASVGIGSRIRLLDHLNGSLDFAIPLITETATRSGSKRLDFRLWGDF
jgi:hemolysin activation/secretion protein